MSDLTIVAIDVQAEGFKVEARGMHPEQVALAASLAAQGLAECFGFAAPGKPPENITVSCDLRSGDRLDARTAAQVAAGLRAARGSSK